MQLKLMWVTVIIFLAVSIPLHSEKEIDLSIQGITRLKDFQISQTDSLENLSSNNYFLKKEKFSQRTYNKNKGRVIWIQKKIKISGKIREFDNIALFFNNLSPAFQVYWDGKNIGNSGKISNDGKVEKSGMIIHLINLKEEIIQEGTHTLTIRLLFSPFTMDRRGGIFIGYKNLFEDWKNTAKVNRRYYFGFFVVLAFISFSLFFTGRRDPSYLFYGIYTGFYSLTNLLSYYIFNDQISIELYRIPSQFLANNDEILGVILILFLLWHFKVDKKKYYIIFLSFLLFVIIFIKYAFLQYVEFYSYMLLIPLHLTAVYISFKSYRKKIPGSLTALLSFVVFMVTGVLNYLLGGVSGIFSRNILHLMIAWFYLTLLLSIIINIQTRNNKTQELMVRSKRLEAELLKRSIQPHFILNTLLSLKSLIASGGNKAEKLIDSLAEEFNLIREISSESKISIKRELELCKLHLKIMGFRRYAKYKLNTDCKYMNAKIPPLILHTLIENGITHSFKPKENGIFDLSCSKMDSDLKICLSNNGSLLGKRKMQKEKTMEEGTGIRYIRSRLNETYDKHWDLEYGVFEDTWMVRITIPFEEEK